MAQCNLQDLPKVCRLPPGDVTMWVSQTLESSATLALSPASCSNVIVTACQIYPSWWGEHPTQPPCQPVKGPEQQPRPPPRLAYSMQQGVKGDPPLHSNDLITTNYLEVPSSGYGVHHTAQPARRALVWEQSEGKDVSTPCDAQLESGKENHAGMHLVHLELVAQQMLWQLAIQLAIDQCFCGPGSFSATSKQLGFAYRVATISPLHIPCASVGQSQ